MKKRTKKKERSKRKERKALFAKMPSNYVFWQFTVREPDELKEFLLRGSERQRTSIIRTLNYMRKFEKLEFEKVNGEYWLEKFKN